MSTHSNPDLGSGQDAQSPGSKSKDSELNKLNKVGPSAATSSHSDEYSKFLQKFLGVFESELSRLKDPQSSGSGVAVTNNTAEANDPQAQDARIQRLTPREWRKVKKGCGIDPKLPVLLVFSKEKSGVERQLAGRGSTRHDDSKPGAGPPLGVASRLCINSSILLDLLRDITGIDFPEDRNVWVRPFKYLVAHETDIREALQAAEVNFDRAKAGSQPFNQTGTNRNDNGPKALGIEHRLEEGQSKTGAAKAEPQAVDIARVKANMDQLSCLVNFMDTDMQDIFEVKRQVAAKTLENVAFDHLWLLYKPNDLVYSMKSLEDSSTYQAYRVLHVTGGRPVLDTTSTSHFDPVYTRTWDEELESDERAQEIIKSSPSHTTTFIIDCFSIDFDGRNLGPKSIRFVVAKYSDKRRVDAFEVCPSFFHPKQGEIYQAMVKRGRRFTQLANGAHKQYSGTTLRESRELWQPSPFRMGLANYIIHDEEVHGEVMLDQASGATHYRKAIEKWRLKIGGGVIGAPTEADIREVFDPLPAKRGEEIVSDVFEDHVIDIGRRLHFVTSTTLLVDLPISDPSLADEYVMLLPFRIYGYAMLNRKWFPLNINLIKDIPPDRALATAAGYEDLVLPDGHKKLLQAIVKNQIRDSKQTSGDRKKDQDEFQMDLVEGKGRGLIILLHGAPGVGKTSTAECVAAQLKRPLLSITCGDVSTNVKQAEDMLQEYCTLAYKWRCVLLLDEADVFLARREKGDITRNALVSVFLRVLEYFSGVIILTTNRVGAFDEAFRSRIHISLYYPKLTQAATLQIWKFSLLRLRNSSLEVDFSEDEILEFAKRHWDENEHKESRHWNGRQIKNAFQTALALANWDFDEAKQRQNLQRPRLKARHFERVAKTSEHFDDYISKIFRTEDAFSVLAARDEIRDDTYLATSLGQPNTQDFVPRFRRANPARRGAALRDARIDESRKPEGGGNNAKLRQLELELELMKLKQANGSEEVQAQAGGEDEEDEW